MTASIKDYLEREVAGIGAAAKAIMDEAQTEGRPLTGAETAKVENLLATAKAKKAELVTIGDTEALRAAIEGFDGVGYGTATKDRNSGPATVGDAFVQSEQYKSLRARGDLPMGVWTTGPIQIGEKLTDGGTPALNVEISPTGTPLQPQVAPLLPPVEEPLTLAARFSQGVATQNSIVYLEETTTTTLLGTGPYSGSTSSAAVTIMGGLKPAVFVDFTKRTTAVEKIAAFLPVADEMVEDEPQIASYINARLVVFVKQAEEAYLANRLLGSGIATADASDDLGGNNLFDAIAAGILKCQTGSGLNPDTVLIHPVDFWKMSITKSASSGDYFSGGPYASPARNPWGIAVVVTREALLNFPIVGAFREGATLWRKGGLQVEASNSHADYFRKDLTAIRAEERIGLTVFRPSAFVKVTI